MNRRTTRWTTPWTTPWTIRWSPIATTGLALVLSAAPLLGQDDTFEWDGRMEAGSTLEVQSIVGNVRAVLAPGDRARVIATKHGDADDFADVDIEIAETRDGIKICVLYGAWNRGDEPCEHRRWRDRDRRPERDLDVSVDFEIQLPAGVGFDGATVSGDVDVIDVRSDVDASTVDGDVTVSTTGLAHANTVNGSMDIEFGSTDWDELDFNTVSGDITLRLPARLDTDVDFHSLSGDFDSDFEMDSERRRRRWVGSRVHGTIGDGGRSLSLKTVSGDVTLLRSR